MNAKGDGDGGYNNKVGPILRSGEIADAVIDALEIDNPGKEFDVDDHVAYVRIHTDDECVVRRKTMEEVLGRPFRMQDIESDLASFAGRIEATTDHMRFYFEKKI